jgi:hypothetical protein
MNTEIKNLNQNKQQIIIQEISNYYHHGQLRDCSL